MMEIQVTIKAPDLSEAINNLAAALSGTGRGAATNVQQPELKEQVQAQLNRTPTDTPAPVAPTVTQPQTTAPTAPAPTTPAPQAQVAAPQQQTATPVTYTLDMLANAMAGLIDMGKMAQCMEAIKKYGVQAINQLSQDMYPAFAEDLKALGAKF